MRKYPKELYDFIAERIPLSHRSERQVLLDDINRTFCLSMTSRNLADYCFDKKLNLGLVRKRLKPGDEYIHGDLWYIVLPDGTRKNKAIYLYEKEFGKIPEDGRVIFLDGNRENFSMDNLFLITVKELGHLGRSKLLTNNREQTLLNISYYRTRCKFKEQAKELGMLDSRGMFKFELHEAQSKIPKEKRREYSRNHLKRMRENNPEKYKEWIKKCNSYKKEK